MWQGLIGTTVAECNDTHEEKEELEWWSKDTTMAARARKARSTQVDIRALVSRQQVGWCSEPGDVTVKEQWFHGASYILIAHMAALNHTHGCLGRQCAGSTHADVRSLRWLM